MTQSELAKKVGTDKTYISRIERSAIDPGVGMFFRIIEALGLRVDIVRPLICSKETKGGNPMYRRLLRYGNYLFVPRR